jgi:Leu/Phe-tRNA-protein transferase
MINTILHNDKVWFTDDGRLEVYYHRLATKLNRLLKTYDSGLYVFEQGEEAVFMVSQDMVPVILNDYLYKKRS